MENKTSTYVIETLPNPYDFKSMLSTSEVNITTRMHACILSTGANVPTMSVNYLFKLKEYMKTIGLNEYSIDIEDFNANDALAMFDKLWYSRYDVRSNLTKIMAERKKALIDDMKIMNIYFNE